MFEKNGIVSVWVLIVAWSLSHYLLLSTAVVSFNSTILCSPTKDGHTPTVNLARLCCKYFVIDNVVANDVVFCHRSHIVIKFDDFLYWNEGAQHNPHETVGLSSSLAILRAYRIKPNTFGHHDSRHRFEWQASSSNTSAFPCIRT